MECALAICLAEYQTAEKLGMGRDRWKLAAVADTPLRLARCRKTGKSRVTGKKKAFRTFDCHGMTAHRE